MEKAILRHKAFRAYKDSLYDAMDAFADIIEEILAKDPTYVKEYTENSLSNGDKILHFTLDDAERVINLNRCDETIYLTIPNTRFELDYSTRDIIAGSFDKDAFAKTLLSMLRLS